MPFSKVSIAEAASRLNAPFAPVNLATVNDMAVNLIRSEGKFQWHIHDEMDEIFYVHSGSLLLETELGNLLLHAGELVYAPANVAHCPSSARAALVLFFLKYRAFPRNGHRQGLPRERTLREKVNIARRARLMNPFDYQDIAHFDDFVVRLVVCDGAQAMHSHPQGDELTLVYEGEARLETSDTMVDLGAGELVVVPTDTPHRMASPERATLLLLSRLSANAQGG